MPIPAPTTVGQFVPVTGIGTDVATADSVDSESAAVVGVADVVAVAVGKAVPVPEPVGVGLSVGVAVAVGIGDAQRETSVVQAAPRDGQQYVFPPQRAVVFTLAIVEQLISCGASPVVAE